MKKIYLLLLLCTLSFSAFSQAVVTTIYSTGAVGSFTTGNSTSSTRTDNNIVATSGNAGYAVFDLSSIPPGVTIDNVSIGFYNITYGGSGTASGWSTNGFAGDLSLTTLPGTLYTDMTSAPAFCTVLSTATYGTVAGNVVLVNTAATDNFIQSNIGSKVSICFSGGNTRSYTIKGENGVTTSITAANHAPYITVTYCATPTAVTATAAPSPLCEFDMLNLTGTATGATNYVWTGPASYTSTSATNSFVSALGSAGVYTLTAINSCGSYSATATATTAAVTVNPIPAFITSGSFSICTGNAATLTDGTSGGTWTSSASGTISVGSNSGLITGVSGGTAVITYTLNTGCKTYITLTDNDMPSSIIDFSTPGRLCDGSSKALNDGVVGGTWDVTSGTTASINTTTGVITGGTTAGVVTVTYTTAGCTPVNYDITVNPVPVAFSGSALMCVGTTTTLSTTTPGGTWTSSSGPTAFVGTSGIVTGASAGFCNISYTLPTGCYYEEPVFVFATPPAPSISSRSSNTVCSNGATANLTDGTSGGSYTTSPGTFATVNTSGLVTGHIVGVETMTYTVTYTSPTSYSCSSTVDVTVDAAPSPIVGASQICENSSITYTDPDLGGTWFTSPTITATVDPAGGPLGILAAGPVTISYVNSDVCASTLDVTINPLPTATITTVGPTTFCAGGSVVLNTPVVAGITYQWDVAGSAISGATTASYTATTSGNYTIVVTDGIGCSNSSANTVVTAGISPVVNNTTPLTFCTGSNVVLTASAGSASGSFTYQWLMNGAAIPGAIANNYVADATGTYQCNVSISGGSGTCTVLSTPALVTVNIPPTPHITSAGAALTTTLPYAAYQWYVNATGIAGATARTYLPSTIGSYRVAVTDFTGCVGYSSAFLVNSVGVPQVNMPEVKIYPNPATDIVHIESPVAVHTIISDMQGRTMIEKTNTTDINISNIANGLYIITIYDADGTRLRIEKLVKE